MKWVTILLAISHLLNPVQTPVAPPFDTCPAKHDAVQREQHGPTVQLETISESISSIWFRHLHEWSDFISIKYKEGFGNAQLEQLGARKTQYETIPIMISSPIDDDRVIGIIRWDAVTTCDTAGPILDIEPTTNCRVHRLPKAQHRALAGASATIHMRCITEDDPTVTHNFYITRISGYQRTPSLIGDITFKGSSGHNEVLPQNHRFVLSDESDKQVSSAVTSDGRRTRHVTAPRQDSGARARKM